jgi:nucleoside-diphosphate-sugar epimerase
MSKIEAQRVLEEELHAATMQDGGKTVTLSWTGIATSVWFDWAIGLAAETFFWVNATNRTITRYGSGDQRTCLTHVDVNGEAVVAVLRNPEKYKKPASVFCQLHHFHELNHRPH